MTDSGKDDDALLRRLYDEPDAEDVDVDGFRRLRGAIADYARATEIEPPSRGLDELMAAARARVPAGRPAVALEPRSVWARLRDWLAPIAAHPALASAAVIVLVAGIAGVLYMKGVTGSDRAASPEGVTIADRQADVHAEVRDVPAITDGVAPVNAVQPEPPPAPGPDPKPARVEGAAPDRRGKKQQPRPPVPADKPAEVATGGLGDGGGAAPGLQDPGTLKLETSPDLAPQTKGTDTNGAPTGEKALPPKAPQPPENAPTVDTTDAGGESEMVEIASDDKDSQPRGPSLDQLTRQARTAARGGDCAVVKALGGRVKRASGDYYKRSFAPDPAIKKCL